MNKINLHINETKIRRLPLVLLLTCLPLFTTTMRGQSNGISLDVPRIVPVSPAVTEMGKYQFYPVSHCTGIPDITIPLYEIVAGEVTIPVSLSYHSAGLRPKERSGVAGTGWTLNLEPSVSRQIRGVADEDFDRGWFYRSRHPEPGNDELKSFQYYEDKVNNVIDTQPDKFTYKLPHGGGSAFAMNPFDPMRTVPLNNDRIKYSGGDIEITDENGVRYSFGGTREKCGDYTTRWLCSSIYSARNPEQELVSFSYYTIPHIINPSLYYNLDDRLIFDKVQNSNGSSMVMIKQTNTNDYYRVEPGNTIGGEASLESMSSTDAATYYSPTSAYVRDELSEAFLTSADYMGNHLSVSYKSTGSGLTHSDVLDEIEVTDADGSLVRKIKFYITPYNNKTSLTKLDSVCISAPGAENRTYSFRYFYTSSVPSIYTTAVDHWGFFTGGESGDQNALPSVTHNVLLDANGLGNMQPFTVHFSGANRNPNAGGTKTGVLNMITDPQGIQTSFSYEGNFGAFRDTSKDRTHRDYLHPVGGLRIGKIETYDPHTRKRIRKYYEYGLTETKDPNFEPVWGGGAIKHIVTQRDYRSSVTNITVDPYTSGITSESLSFYNCMPVSNITFNNGSPVMYNIVSEMVYGDSEPVQKTLYYYRVLSHDYKDLLEWDDDDPAGSVADFVMNSITEKNESLVRNNFDLSHELSDDYTYGLSNQMFGVLLRKEQFSDGELVASTENVYSSQKSWMYDSEVIFPERLMIIDPEVYLQHTVGGSAHTSYSFFLDMSTCRVLDKEINKRYYNVDGRQDVVTTEKKFTYTVDWGNPGSSLSPRQISTIRSDSTQVIDYFDYLADYPAILSLHKHTEGEYSSESRILFKPASCLPEKVQSRTDAQEEYRDEVVYRCYDSYNNVTEIAGKDGTPISFIWGYRNRFPVARIENATINEVYTALGVSNADMWAESDEPTDSDWNDINSLRTKIPKARVTTYKYNPLHGVVSVTDPNNVVTGFDYDNYSRLTEGYYWDEDSRKIMLQKYIYNFGK